MDFDAVRRLQDGIEETYVLFWPPEDIDPSAAFASVALVVMKRPGGLLLALPFGFVPQAEMQGAGQAEELLLGPHTILQVPGVRREETAAVPSGSDITVQVVDILESACKGLVKFADAAVDQELLTTFSEDPSVFPDGATLLSMVREWAESLGAARATFYSAAEAPPGETTPGGKARPKGDKAKKPTTAQVTAQRIQTMASMLPTIASQLAELQQNQVKMQEELRLSSISPPPRPSQMPATMRPLDFVQMVGAPPVTKQLPHRPPPPRRLVPTQDAKLSPQEQAEEDEMQDSQQPLAMAMLEQSRALSALVVQLQQGEPLLDVSATGSSTSSRGTMGREKMQRELAARSGNYFLSVMQNMHRRLKPAVPVPANLQQMAQSDVSMVHYLERFGGYGNVRDMGIVQYALAYIVDMALRQDMAGLQEHLALLIVGIEQYAQDGRWDLAFPLTLLDDPPPQMWAFRNPMGAQTGRARAFAPLCPQRWATIALAYMKENDFIMNRRAEVGKRDTQNPPPQPAQVAPKRRGKFPKAKAAAKAAQEQEAAE